MPKFKEPEVEVQVQNRLQSFSFKINCTEVKYTATKLHISPDKTDSRGKSSESVQWTC